jgi:hypothetical protein
MVLFFIYDEVTDNVNGDGARAYASLVLDVLRDPHVERPQDESKLGEITRQYARPSSVILLPYLAKRRLLSY